MIALYQAQSRWGGYTPRTEQTTFYELLERRIDLARGIELNIRITNKSEERSLGSRTEEEMDRLQDPAWKKLVARRMRESSLFRDRQLAYLMERMMDRSMKSEEYEAIKEGQHPYLKRETFVGRVVKDLIAIPFLVVAANDGSYA
ncbi:hypothetical protein HYV80_03390 [Candidatus Woesearchaeota archaeon]|nr:hypothetical protein [Candidatus Woesearchaeota archaeon]